MCATMTMSIHRHNSNYIRRVQCKKNITLCGNSEQETARWLPLRLMLCNEIRTPIHQVRCRRCCCRHASSLTRSHNYVRRSLPTSWLCWLQSVCLSVCVSCPECGLVVAAEADVAMFYRIISCRTVTELTHSGEKSIFPLHSIRFVLFEVDYHISWQNFAYLLL